ncbi:MAG: hypothetical protein K6G84_00550 [Lachnospiraceae bacterium]|nr:hypothetical protein [Lachnospiraceae bacterium]
MTNRLICTIKKDFREYMRGKKNMYFSISLLLIGIMIISTTLFFPALIEALAQKAPDMVSNVGALDELMAKLFPDNIKGSLGIWYSDVGVFYSIVLVLTIYGLIVNEIKSGKWIMPVASGYKKMELVISKNIVYSVGAAFPVFVLSNVYYIAGLNFFTNDIGAIQAVVCSAIMSLSVIFITVTTLLSSVLYKNSITAGISNILIIMVAPDILTYFSFGKYFPTYLLTFVYTVSDNYSELIIPVVEMILICLILFFLVDKKIRKIEISR